MKGNSQFGYKFVAALTIVVALAQVAASGYDLPLDYYDDPEPAADTPSHARVDTPVDLRFPIRDRTGNPLMDQGPASMDLKDPKNLERQRYYDPETGRYYFSEKMGESFIRNPHYLTMEEYFRFQGRQQEREHWKRRLDALTLFNDKPQLPQMYKEGIFDRIFGGNAIEVRPQGNVDVTFGGNWQNNQNPSLPLNAQKYGVVDFDMDMNVNLVATVGEKLKLNISNNTRATFDYQNVQKLEYTGKEDEIIKKIEAGSVSFPLNSSLISGVQSLFGIKTQLQFGKLWVTGVVSQQRSKRQSLTIQGGSQTQNFEIKADDYEENRHFLLSQYFYEHYDNALREYPIIHSQVNINRIEVWVTNRTGATEGVRTILAFQDLGEQSPAYSELRGATQPIPSQLPDNRANKLYSRLVQNPASRQQGSYMQAIQSSFPQDSFANGTDYFPTTARKLTLAEFTYHPQLGYLSLNTQLNPDDVLAVAFRYTYNGQVYQVGEFAEDLPPTSDTGMHNNDQRILFLKLLKGTSLSPQQPVWNLMMKNVYALGGLGVTKDEFRLNILYQDPGGGEKRYLPEGDMAGVPLLTLLNLDRLNYQNDPAPDGIFDYVEGITINTQQGKIIFPVLQPFGRNLKPALGNPQLERKYLYEILYDSTKTVARQFQQNNRYVIKGSFKSSSSSEIFLGGFNIPQGSVSVTAGGQILTENVDYQIDYGMGRLKILNSGILNSGIPINVQYEDNATFGFQQQNFMGARMDYFLNEKLSLGGTFMRLTERPFTAKTTLGEDPIKNTVLGLDLNYQSESASLTRLLDKLPIYSTTVPSFVSISAEVAGLLPSHPRQIDALDPEGSVYIDDFEGTRSAYDLKFPVNAWSLASVPVGAVDKNGNPILPEASRSNDLSYGYNRALLSWYFLEPLLVDPAGGVPDFVKKDSMQHYIRIVQQQDVFKQKSTNALQNALSTFDLAFYPRDRGPYNFNPQINPDGTLPDPASRWAGIMRAIDNTDFEQSNVEFVEFWVMDPFIGKPNSTGGSLYINLGNVSEDVLKDSRKFFENGLPYPENPQQVNQSVWGQSPALQQQITQSFDSDPAARAIQDVGYDGLDNEREREHFSAYINQISVDPDTRAAILADPSNDDFRHFRDAYYESTQAPVLSRYKAYNNPQGNSPINDASTNIAQGGNIRPESEDINRDNTLNESEDYFQYRIDLKPDMEVGTNYIINKQVSQVRLPNGQYADETWYQFKVPIRDYHHKVGNISDFRSIRFMRLFLHGFEDSVILRFARLELGRNNWRRYMFSMQDPGGYPVPEDDTSGFTVTSVSLEEHGDRQPIPYVLPPGVSRQLTQVSNAQTIQLNEQSLALQFCGLVDGDARAVFREVNMDLRQFNGLRMFIHAESQVGNTPLRDGDVRAIIRIGSDFTNNYYEYQIPLTITAAGEYQAETIWPKANQIDLLLEELVKAKTNRNLQGRPSFVPYEERDSKGNTIFVIGNPNLGEAKTIMLGIMNPRRSEQNLQDDGMAKCGEVWFNELRLVGMNEKPGYASAGRVAIQLADLGSLNLNGSMHSEGYGNIDQKLNQRFRNQFYQYNASANLNLGKLMPRNWGVQLPLFVGFSENVSNPQYDPYDLDVRFRDKLNMARSAAQRDSLRKAAQDYTSIASFNLSNVRIMGNPEKQSKAMPWSVKNFDISYAYNQQFKRNPILERDVLTNQRLGLGYTYALKTRSIEPFRKLIKSRSKWLGLIRDINFNPLPTNFTFRTNLDRVFNETQVRNISGDAIQISPTYFKNFLWDRTYNLRWELTRSLSFDYQATNNSRIDEPYGRIDSKAKEDSLWREISHFGRNTFYTQSFNAAYSLPLQKLPVTDWTNLRIQYGSSYNWTGASLLARSLGNTLANTQTIQVNGELNFAQLYNKQRWLKAVNAPRSPGANRDPRSAVPPKPDRKIKDLRSNRPGEDVQEELNRSLATDQGPDTSGFYDIASNVARLSDRELDSVRREQQAILAAMKKAEKKKRKQQRKERRLARRNSVPEISKGEEVGGRLLTMVKRTTFSYSESSGTILPGYMDSTRFLGMNRNYQAPGFDFIYGYQPDRAWLEAQASEARLSRDTLFNAQFQQTFQQNINITSTVEPLRDLRIDLSLTRSFSKTHNELFKDTSLSGVGEFTHNNPYQSGSFTVSHVGMATLFRSSTVNSGAYRDFLDNRTVISSRVSHSNPYSKEVPDPQDPRYGKGYTQFSQDVLIPAFIAAYTGKSPREVPLIDYSGRTTRSNPFGHYLPRPNWRINYNGLAKIPFFAEHLTNLVVTHGYTGSLSMNSFVSALFYEDIYSMGFPSFIDSNSGNFVPFYQVPNVTMTEQLNPLFGVDASFKNNLTARFDYRRSRAVTLSLVDYQVSETHSIEYVFGLGYRVRGLNLPFEIFGVRKLENDLNLKVDVGIRDDSTSNHYLAQNIAVVTRGQKVITISPSVDYIVSDRLTLRFFYDRRRTIPHTTSSFPMSTTRAGITLRFIFAQ